MGLSFYTAKHEPTEVGCRYHAWKAFVWAIGDVIGLKHGKTPGGDWTWMHPWPNSPLVTLCRHSGSDGELSPIECGEIAPLLKEISQKLPEAWMKKFAHELADLMAMCSIEDRHLIFS